MPSRSTIKRCCLQPLKGSLSHPWSALALALALALGPAPALLNRLVLRFLQHIRQPRRLPRPRRIHHPPRLPRRRRLHHHPPWCSSIRRLLLLHGARAKMPARMPEEEAMDDVVAWRTSAEIAATMIGRRRRRPRRAVRGVSGRNLRRGSAGAPRRTIHLRRVIIGCHSRGRC